MLRFFSLAIALFGAVAPLAFPCSVPQVENAKPQSPHTVEQLLDAGHFRRAQGMLPANVSGPSTAQTYLLSRIQLGFRQLDAAMQSAEAAVAAEPKNAQYHVQLAAVAGREAEHAAMFKQIGLAKRVRKELEEALALDPKNGDALYGMMLFANIAPSFMGGDKNRAQQLAEQLTALDPSRGLLAQASLAHDRHDADAEQALLKKAVAANPQSYDARLALATFHWKGGARNLENADEQACEALYLDPTRGEAWQILAEMAGASGCLEEVDGIVSTQQQFNPDDFSSSYSAAVGIIESGFHYDIARALLKQYVGKPPEGNSPSVGLARYRLATIAEKEGDTQQAIELLHAALEEDPSVDDARKALKRLEHPAKP